MNKISSVCRQLIVKMDVLNQKYKQFFSESEEKLVLIILVINYIIKIIATLHWNNQSQYLSHNHKYRIPVLADNVSTRQYWRL